jgi:NitT/TauT family transport system ATP-binding protein
VFDKVRLDPHAPQAYGARITYGIPLNEGRRASLPKAVEERLVGRLSESPNHAQIK